MRTALSLNPRTFPNVTMHLLHSGNSQRAIVQVQHETLSSYQRPWPPTRLMNRKE